jgi:hypothetical protein
VGASDQFQPQLLSLTHQTLTQTVASYTYTVDAVGHRAAVTETVRQPGQTAAPNVLDTIFADGFETGNTGGWTSVTGTGLSVTGAAALAGSLGLQVTITNTTARYLTDNLPSAELRYRARFYFDSNSIAMTNGNAHYVFYGYSGASIVVLRLELRCATAACPGAGSYQLRAALINDSWHVLLRHLRVAPIHVHWPGPAKRRCDDDDHLRLQPAVSADARPILRWQVLCLHL